MAFLRLTYCFLLIVSLVSPGASCPDISNVKDNLSIREKLEMAEIIVYVNATKEGDQINYKVECVLKTDGFMVEDNIDISLSNCPGAGALPEWEGPEKYEDNIFVALIQRSANGYVWENFGNNETAHFGSPRDEVESMNEACGLAPCPLICANILSQPCPSDDGSESPLVQVVKRMIESPLSIQYEAAPWTFAACCKSKQYSGGITELKVSDMGTEIPPRLMRNVPTVKLDSGSKKYHTVLMAEVSGMKPELGTKSKPYIHWQQVNLQNGGRIYPNYTVFSYEKPIPRDPSNANQYAFFIFEQEEFWETCDDDKDQNEKRRHFDISLLQDKAELKLIYGSYVQSSTEVYTRVEEGDSNIDICRDTWDDLIIVGKTVVCPGSKGSTSIGTTARGQGNMLLGAFLAVIAILFKLI